MQYRITTRTDKTLIATSEAHLAELVQELKDSVRSIKEYTFKTKKPKSACVLTRFTAAQKEKYTQRALSLGCGSLQEYIKILILMDTELQIFIPATKSSEAIVPKSTQRKTDEEI